MISSFTSDVPHFAKTILQLLDKFLGKYKFPALVVSILKFASLGWLCQALHTKLSLTTQLNFNHQCEVLETKAIYKKKHKPLPWRYQQDYGDLISYAVKLW